MCREIIVSGLVGYTRKMKRKVRDNIPKYRSGQFSLRYRVNKKLTEKYNWFKSIKVNDETEDNGENVNKLSKQSKCKWNHYRKKSTPIEALEKVKQKDSPAQAVLFVQYTDNGELASRIRDVVQQLRPWTGINIKIVERVGQKLEDGLHKSKTFGELIL